MRILAAIGMLAMLGGASLAAQVDKRFSLSGTVVDGLSKHPLTGVEVMLRTGIWEPVGDSILSDQQGRFHFDGLAAGGYILSATASGFGTVNYGAAIDPGWPSTVRVGAQGKDKSVVFSILPRASIEGTVRDEFGDPMVRVTVAVLRPSWNAGKAALGTVTQKQTDDRGRYRFGALAPGGYLVCAGQNGPPAAVPGPVDFATRPGNRAYMRTCYPAGDGDVPHVVQLAAGQHSQIDLVPLSTSSVTVSGRVRNVPPQATYTGFLEPEHAAPGNFSRYSINTFDAQGAFLIRNVPPGRYTLLMNLAMVGDNSDQKRLIAETAVNVGSSDVEGVDVAFEPGATVDVTFQGLAGNQVEQGKVGAGLRSVKSGRSPGTILQDKSGFHFSSVPAGRYWLTGFAPGDACVDSFKIGDREVRGKAIDVAANTSVHVEASISEHCGAIEVRAVREGQAVPGAKVVLLVSGTPQDPGDMSEDFADDEGAYTFLKLPPGRYLVWAWAVGGDGPNAAPASLAEAAQQATAVEVKAGEPVKMDVPVLKAKEQLP